MFERLGSVLVLTVFLAEAATANAAGDAERGRVVFALAAGCGCHTPASGPVGAGGGKVPTPFGTFYGTNITPDPETGIGGWTDGEIAAAIRAGVRRDGSTETPAMPYDQYAGLADRDVSDLIAYLRSLPPVRRANRPHEGEVPLARWTYRAWRWLFVRWPEPRATAPPAGVERGRYLVDHVSICGDCHTPRTRLGAPDRTMYLAGSAHGPDGKPVPNLTPHATGLLEFDAGDIVNVLTLGMLPNMDNVQGFMADVVDGHGGGPGYKDAPDSDRRAIAEYLKTVPPIDNDVGDK
ncbi:MAG TPA: c-type cytochrome [Candidatus Kryptonia bacterium]|nr:c-type cytochrome [Candidatus Kryptonia bacterium]